MIHRIGDGPTCKCGRITAVMSDELGRTTVECLVCDAYVPPPSSVVVIAAAQSTPGTRRRRSRVRLGLRKYKPRQCTNCPRVFQPTGSRGDRCDAC